MRTCLRSIVQSLILIAMLSPALRAAPIADLNPGAGGSRGEAFSIGVRQRLEGTVLPSPLPAVYFCAGPVGGGQVQARVLSRNPSASNALAIETLRRPSSFGGPPITPVFYTRCHLWIAGPQEHWFLFADRIENGVEALEIWVTQGDGSSFRQVHRFQSAGFGGAFEFRVEPAARCD